MNGRDLSQCRHRGSERGLFPPNAASRRRRHLRPHWPTPRAPQIAHHLHRHGHTGDVRPRRDVTEADRREHGHREVQRIGLTQRLGGTVAVTERWSTRQSGPAAEATIDRERSLSVPCHAHGGPAEPVRDVGDRFGLGEGSRRAGVAELVRRRRGRDEQRQRRPNPRRTPIRISWSPAVLPAPSTGRAARLRTARRRLFV